MHRAESRAELEASLLAPLVKPQLGYTAAVGFLVGIVIWGIYAWVTQLQYGLVVTGMRDQVFWGLYISTFVFFVSVSLTGTLISAVLRLSGYKWQVPITRLAEVITGVALLGAAAMIVADMGRPERLLNVFIYGRLQSPLIWDVAAITTYLVGSLIYLYLPLIPDLALCRDRLGNAVPGYQRRLYSFLALGWQDTPAQRKKLEKAMGIMAVTIIPVAVSVHSVTAWIYAMTFRPGWDNAILAPYFVVSAFLSGVAMVILLMTAFRKAFRLERYLTQEHYAKLGWLLLALTLVYAYFSFAELLPGGYKLEGHEQELLTLLFTGQQAGLFWFSILGGMVLPVLLTCWRRTRTVAGLNVAALLVIVSLWIKKSFLLVVPTLQVPLMPFPPGVYQPTWTEWSITIAGLAGFVLAVMVVFRFIPLLPVWEMVEEGEKQAARSVGRLEMTGRMAKVKGGA